MTSDSRNFATTLLVDQTPGEVFNAVTNVRGWWSQGIQGGTRNLNDEFIFEVAGVHRSRQKLIEVVPDQKIVWMVMDSNMSFIEDNTEWTGTKVRFDISRQGDKTRLTFTHEGLVPEAQCFNACAPAWTQYVQHSLQQLIATGKGDPNLEGRRIEAIDPEQQS